MPAGYLWVVRDVSWYANNAGLGSNYYFLYITGEDEDTTIDWFTVDADTTVMHHQELRVAVTYGQELWAHADGPSDVTVTGYALTLP